LTDPTNSYPFWAARFA